MGSKERIIEQNRYAPRYSWQRDSRVISRNGATETFKMKGDFIIRPLETIVVKESGWGR